MASSELVISQSTQGDAPYELQLQVLDHVAHALDNAESLEEVKQIRDRAAAVKVYAHNARLGLELQNRAAEIKLRAERKAGRLLKSMRLRGGDRRSNGHHHRLNLTDLGISPNQSKRWQKQAAISEEQFEQFLRESAQNGFEVTAAGLLRRMRGSQPGRNHPKNPLASGRGAAATRQHVAEEIVNHCRTLMSIIAPLWENSTPFEPRIIERRTVKRLLQEVAKLAVSLKERHDP